MNGNLYNSILLYYKNKNNLLNTTNNIINNKHNTFCKNIYNYFMKNPLNTRPILTTSNYVKYYKLTPFAYKYY